MSEICINQKLYLNTNNVNITIYNSDNIDITEHIYNRDKKLIIDENVFSEKFSYINTDGIVLERLFEEYLTNNLGTYLLDIDELDNLISELEEDYGGLTDTDKEIIDKLRKLIKYGKTMLHSYGVYYEYEIYSY